MGNNKKQMLSGYVAATVYNCYGNNLFWRGGFPKLTM